MMKMNKKEVIVEGIYWAISLMSGICAFGMGIALYFQHLYEPNIIIRAVEVIWFIISGVTLCIWSFSRFARNYMEYVREKMKGN